MTKFEAIKELEEKGFFVAVGEAISIIESDTNDCHKANSYLLSLLNKMRIMNDWTQFSVKQIIDFSARIFGIMQCMGYQEIDAIYDDAYDAVEEVYEISRYCYKIIENS